jgi:hypothetical protein
MNPLDLINRTGGKFFHVKFRKKNGEVRNMTCRTGVSKHVRGGGLAFDPESRNLKVVFDTSKRAYRMINLSTLMEFSCGNLKWSSDAILS